MPGRLAARPSNVGNPNPEVGSAGLGVPLRSAVCWAVPLSPLGVMRWHHLLEMSQTEPVTQGHLGSVTAGPGQLCLLPSCLRTAAGLC